MRLDASIALGIDAGGPGSGCQGPNCGRPGVGKKREWVNSGLAKLIRNELEQAGYKIHVYGKIPDTELGKRFSLGEQFTYQHPEGHRATVSVGLRPQDNYWAIKHTSGHHSGKLYELKKAKKVIEGKMAAASEAAEPPVGALSRENDHEQEDWFDDPAKEKEIEADFEPTMQHAHLDVRQTFHPPSLEKRGRADHVPTDDPGETDDKYLDVTKRNSKDTEEQRMNLLRRSIPGGNPPLIPVKNVAQHMPQAFNMMMSVQKTKPKVMLKQRPVNWDKQAHQKVSYARRGCM